MNKPNNFDETKAGGDFTPIELGAHHAVIMSVKEQKSSTGKDMAVIALDFAKNDSQAGYFKDQFNNDDRAEKKWPYQAIQYIVTEDGNGGCSRSFKSFITAFEHSNGCQTIWGDKFAAQFKGKKIGVVYGEVEELYDGEIKTRRRIRWFCDDSKVEKQNVPEKKTYANALLNSATVEPEFMDVPNGKTDDIPF